VYFHLIVVNSAVGISAIDCVKRHLWNDCYMSNAMWNTTHSLSCQFTGRRLGLMAAWMMLWSIGSVIVAKWTQPSRRNDRGCWRFDRTWVLSIIILSYVVYIHSWTTICTKAEQAYEVFVSFLSVGDTSLTTVRFSNSLTSELHVFIRAYGSIYSVLVNHKRVQTNIYTACQKTRHPAYCYDNFVKT